MSVSSRALDALARMFVRVLEILGSKRPDPTLDLWVGPVSNKRITREGVPPMNLILNNEQKCSVAIDPKTAAGNPAPVDGIPTWESSDPSVATVEPSEDGKSASIVTGDGAIGTATINVTADADLGEGIRSITDTVNLMVVQPEADTLGLGAGEPELK